MNDLDSNAERGGRAGEIDTVAVTLAATLDALRRHLILLVALPLLCGVAALGATYLIPPTFTASTTFMPPQQVQGATAAALASLGPLASIAGGAVGLRSTGEQYVALMRSVTVSDRLIERFDLLQVYDVPYRIDARTKLAANVSIVLGRRDGLISVAVDDHSPQRAADIANRYVEELRQLAGSMALTQAQQRRAFFEQQLQLSRDRLAKAQQALQTSGFNPGALKAEPKAAAERFAKLQAETTAAEVRLKVLRGSLTDEAAEVRQQQATLAALREQLARSTAPTDSVDGPDYIGRYREFKYQETLFELYSRQFELARVDESSEGALIQVVDVATPPERKSRPARARAAIMVTLLSAVLLVGWILWRESRRARAHGGIAAAA